jgi:hypothetical protein
MSVCRLGTSGRGGFHPGTPWAWQELELLILRRDRNEYLLFPAIKRRAAEGPGFGRGQGADRGRARKPVQAAAFDRPPSLVVPLPSAGRESSSQVKPRDQNARRPLHGRHGVLPRFWRHRATQQLLGDEDIGTTSQHLRPTERGEPRAQARPDLRDRRCGQRRSPPLNCNRFSRQIPISREMEAAGIEPASADAPVRASTSVGCPLLSPAGRCAADLPTG